MKRKEPRVTDSEAAGFMYDVDEYVRNPEAALPALAGFLNAGSLVLGIGAGASKGMGLPDWATLVKRCANETNRRAGTSLALPAGTDTRTLGRTMNRVETAIARKLDMGRSTDYRALVRDCLYQGVTYDNDSMLRQGLLIAFGALLVRSRRGSVREVFNFNFDDVLDWYLALHGLDTQIVTRVPTLLREADITIYHPHGFLPLDAAKRGESDFLVLSQHSYDDKLGDRVDRWLDLFTTTMTRRIMLFVGLSGDDQTFYPSLVAAHKLIGRERYTGFWLLGPDDTQDRIDDLKDRNVVPLRLASYDQYPDYLLEICRQALAG